jgi:AraC family transcriptional regulator
MEPKIEILAEKKVIGKKIIMTLSKNRTFELWSSFMPRRKEIKNPATTELLSLQIYDKSLNFKDFNQDTEFEKWAAIEVSGFDYIPEGMETLVLKSGLYAVFNYKGSSQDFSDTFQYIFGTWLPNSNFELDTRPHFEILGEKYKNNDPNSEEEIWIPIKLKSIH